MPGMRLLRWSLPLLALAALLVADACAGRPEAGSYESHDSAGVTIVENGPIDDGVTEWLVPDSPLVSLGGRPGDPGHDLNRVTGARWLPGARILVADGGSAQLRVFDSAGAFVEAVGREGAGPGEFRRYVGLLPSFGDSIITVDGAQRYTVFSQAPAFVRAFRVEPDPRYRFASIWGRMRGGPFVAVTSEWDSAVATGTIHRPMLRFIRLDRTGGYDGELVRIPGPEQRRIMASEGGRPFPADDQVQFGRQTVYAVTATRLVVGLDDRFELREYDRAGALRRIIRVDEEPEDVTAAHREEQIRRNLEPIAAWRQGSPEARAAWEERVRNAAFSDRFPFYGGVMPGPGGSLLVQRFQRPGERFYQYLVLDATGRVAATLRLPDRVRPFHVGQHLVLGRWQDANDVEYVRVYPIRR